MSRLVTRAEKHRQITGTTICQECRKPWPCDYEKGRADERQRIVKALHLGYLDALDDVQDRLKDMGQVWCNAHGSHVSRNDVHLLLDELRKP